MTTFKRLFLDSRHRLTGGTHADWTVELSTDQACSKTTSVYLSSLSLSNTFETISPLNNNLFYMVQEDAPAPAITPNTQNLYVCYQRDKVLQASGLLYLMLTNPTAGVLIPNTLYAVSVASSTTVQQLATNVQAAIRTVVTGATVVYNDTTDRLDIVFNPEGSASGWWIPNSQEIASGVTRFNAVLNPGTVLPQGDTLNATLNALLNMPLIQSYPSQYPFTHSTSSGVISYTIPTVCDRLAMSNSAKPSVALLADLIRNAVNFVLPGVTVTAGSGSNARKLSIDTGKDWWKLRIPTYSELTSSTWMSANWTGPSYIGRSYNSQLSLPPSSLARTLTTGDLPPWIGYIKLELASSNFQTGSALATHLQTAIQPTVADISVSFDPTNGTMLFSSSSALRFPSDREIRDPSWVSSTWFGNPYDVSDPLNFGAMLYFANPSSLQQQTRTGNIDLVPYKEVLLCCSITNNRTLQSGPSGARDILARCPVDVPFGEVITYRHLGPADAISVSGQQFRLISFQLRSWDGKLLPVDQSVQVELSFISSDPNEL